MSRVNIDGGLIEKAIMTGLRLKAETRTLSGNIALTVDSPTMQFLDPGGAARTVTLPAEAASEGLVFFISNEADAAEVITVKDDGGGTIATPTQNEACIVFCNGTAWSGLVGATS